MKLMNNNLANKSVIVCDYWIFNCCSFTISYVCLEYERNMRIKCREWVKVKEVTGQRVGRTDYVDGTMPQMPGKNDEKAVGRWNSGAHFANLLAVSTSRFVLSTWMNDNGRNARVYYSEDTCPSTKFLSITWRSDNNSNDFYMYN